MATSGWWKSYKKPFPCWKRGQLLTVASVRIHFRPLWPQARKKHKLWMCDCKRQHPVHPLILEKMLFPAWLCVSHPKANYCALKLGNGRWPIATTAARKQTSNLGGWWWAQKVFSQNGRDEQRCLKVEGSNPFAGLCHWWTYSFLAAFSLCYGQKLSCQKSYQADEDVWPCCLELLLLIIEPRCHCTGSAKHSLACTSHPSGPAPCSRLQHCSQFPSTVILLILATTTSPGPLFTRAHTQ